jgi:hypothetical protein
MPIKDNGHTPTQWLCEYVIKISDNKLDIDDKIIIKYLAKSLEINT